MGQSFHIENAKTSPDAAAGRQFKRATFTVLTLLLYIASLTGCESAVDPIVGTDLPFTAWGFMNANSDTQFVRVFPITDELVPDRGEAIDARVFSNNLTTGDRREWTYERVQFDSLIQGNIFWSPFRAEHNHRYRLEIVRSDGATSSATVTVPPMADFQIDVNVGMSTVVPVTIVGDAPNLVGLRVTYHAVNVPPSKAWPIGTNVADAVQLPVSIIYDNLLEREGDTWSIKIDLTRDRLAVEAFYRVNCLITGPLGSAPDIWLRSIEFSALIADSSWSPPGGSFDPNVLSVPGTFSNVENGYGFFGAGQAIHREWTPNVAVAQAAGYAFESQCDYLAPINSAECRNPPIPCVGENITDLWRIWLR